MMAIVPIRDIGMARMTLSVLESEPRNIQQTRAVRMTDRMSSSWISLTESSMKTVESKTVLTDIPSGRVLAYSAMAALADLATATALAPRCFLMPMALGGDAVDAGHPPDVLETVLDQADVAEVDGAPVDLADDDVAGAYRGPRLRRGPGR